MLIILGMVTLMMAIIASKANRRATVMAKILSIRRRSCKFQLRNDLSMTVFNNIPNFSPIFRVENDDSITEDPDKQNGNANDSGATHAFARDQLMNAQQNSPAVGLSLRSLNSMRSQQPPTPLTNGDSSQIIGANQTIALDSESEMSTHNQSYKRSSSKNPSAAKFEAFGQFIASSLIDLPEKNALELVEKFTSEIVKTLITSKSAATNTNADKE